MADTLLDVIREWAKERPWWQKEALRRLEAKGEPLGDDPQGRLGIDLGLRVRRGPRGDRAGRRPRLPRVSSVANRSGSRAVEEIDLLAVMRAAAEFSAVTRRLIPFLTATLLKTTDLQGALKILRRAKNSVLV